VDLLDDRRHCGSCGNMCSEEWAEVLSEFGLAPAPGFTPDDVGLTDRCEDADCTFVCSHDPRVGIADLFEDPNNCGACERSCAVPGERTACQGGVCFCENGLVCDGQCVLPSESDNCPNGCCPVLDGPGRFGEINGRHEYRLPATQRARLGIIEVDIADCADVDLSVNGYADGEWSVGFDGENACDPLVFADLPNRQYAVFIQPRRRTNGYSAAINYRNVLTLMPGAARDVMVNDGIFMVVVDQPQRSDIAFQLTNGCEGQVEALIIPIEGGDTIRQDADCDFLPQNNTVPFSTPAGPHAIFVRFENFAGGVRAELQ
jgi:hypothetical protein